MPINSPVLCAAEITLEPCVENRNEKRNKYWGRLRKARKLYEADHADKEGFIDANAFLDYMEKEYGIRGELQHGMYTENYKIVDEAKYMFFLLKTE